MDNINIFVSMDFIRVLGFVIISGLLLVGLLAILKFFNAGSYLLFFLPLFFLFGNLLFIIFVYSEDSRKESEIYTSIDISETILNQDIEFLGKYKDDLYFKLDNNNYKINNVQVETGKIEKIEYSINEYKLNKTISARFNLIEFNNKNYGNELTPDDFNKISADFNKEKTVKKIIIKEEKIDLEYKPNNLDFPEFK